MKLLIVSGCVFAPNTHRLSFSGLDYVVSDIASVVSRVCDVDIYTFTPYSQDASLNGIPIKSCSYLRIIRFLKYRDIRTYFRILISSLPSPKRFVKNMLAFLHSKNIEEVIKEGKYDLVHVHGATAHCFFVSLACSNTHTQLLYTLHGLLSFGNSIVDVSDKKSEIAIFQLLKYSGSIMTTVSSGTKKLPCAKYLINPDRVRVINNAVSFPAQSDKKDLNEIYPKTIGKKIIVCVGSISDNKNQMQLIRAFKLLPKYIIEQSIIVFAGPDTTDGVFSRYIQQYGLSENVIECGYVSKAVISSIYMGACINVLLSKHEGFGLSIIEAAHYGVPTLTFEDLEAIEDVYDDEYLYCMKDRSDKTVADGIIYMYNKLWDKNKIILAAKKFDIPIYKSYIDVYNELQDLKSNYIDNELANKILNKWYE